MKPLLMVIKFLEALDLFPWGSWTDVLLKLDGRQKTIVDKRNQI